MIIRHNLEGNFAQRIRKNTNGEIAKSMEKLSTVIRINRAADDAAGLSISEKMRGQIRGLNQASRNTQDAISLIQVADGAMNEITSILQRLRELSVQASNGTYNEGDREALQAEVVQLTQEVEKIGKTTQFNNVYILDGQYDKDGNIVASESLDKYLQHITMSGGVNEKYNYNGTDYASAVIDFSNISSSSDVANLIGKGVNYTCCTCNKAYSIKFVNGNPDTSRLNDYNPVMEVDVSSITNGSDLVNIIIETAYGQSGFVYDPQTNSGLPSSGAIPPNATQFVTHFSQLASNGEKLYIYDNRPTYASSVWPQSGRGTFELNVYGETEEEKDKFLFINIQTGSNSDQNFEFKIPNISLQQLGIQDFLISSQENANESISIIDNSIKKISRGRSSLGDYENRLSHTYNNVVNYRENLQSSESRIRDLDMANEIMELTKNTVLLEATQSMMIHENQKSQQILNLLK